jgi:predicted SAM-dependent methyltransferase
MIFKDSKLVHKYLDGLKGIEIGGSAHNPYNVDTINVDKKLLPAYAIQQKNLCGKVLNVDVEIITPAKLPFDNKSYDFVLASHVIEHIYRPDLAIIEWARVSKSYICLVIPHKDRTFDKDRTETHPDEIFKRDNPEEYPDMHHNVWKPESFLKFIVQLKNYVEVVEVQDPDDKVGNGFTVILKVL